MLCCDLRPRLRGPRCFSFAYATATSTNVYKVASLQFVPLSSHPILFRLTPPAAVNESHLRPIVSINIVVYMKDPDCQELFCDFRAPSMRAQFANSVRT